MSAAEHTEGRGAPVSLLNQIPGSLDAPALIVTLHWLSFASVIQPKPPGIPPHPLTSIVSTCTKVGSGENLHSAIANGTITVPFDGAPHSARDVAPTAEL